MQSSFAQPIRTFIAIELPVEVKNDLKQLVTNLKNKEACPAKWVDSDAIHLTLKFLGNIGPDKIDLIKQIMRESAAATGPFHLQLGGLGAFPNLNRAQVVWVGITGDLDNLESLQQKLEQGLAGVGFTPERRPFTPHLTLARVRETATLSQRQLLGERISGQLWESSFKIGVDSYSLMRSQLSRSGAVYTQLASIDL
jgi:2'-5' RNA ligase